jgi:hypothetical protein
MPFLGMDYVALKQAGLITTPKQEHFHVYAEEP